MVTTIRDVARAAGVSPATVSRALSSPDLVHPDTRARVETEARRLGYQPNRAAQGLITGRTGTIGLIVPDLSNPFFAGVVKGIQGAARARDYSVFIADTDEEPAVETEVVRALSKQVDGIVLASPRMSDEELSTLGLSTPVVLMNRRVGDLPSIVADNADAMRQALSHLSALGHHRVAYVAGPRTSWSNSERTKGLSEAAAEFSTDLVDVGNFPPQFVGGVAAADIVLASRATAVVAYNDLIAVGLLNRLGTRGIAVPDRISVVGCDDIPMSGMTHPALTTVAIPQHQAGRASISLLMSLLTDGSVQTRQRELPTQLIVRATTGVAPTT